ncbi:MULTISPECIES: cupin domain-containing protein [unclassified Caballeronia]|uniref:cupin domain-containing protein n=1 Tax=unclassified Caballeronia TaxID=2646786 RepID=UPI002861E968|nr:MULTISPECIES: cupin domain-containing protein [unclassified Caballeronia]MDR5777510.1 cupin domain-containing protein [Caballeronia sp. LZ002]MDR5798579.1 cupin domain-containing protein [Caballeronia sp. LZ001]MDR5852950.1 cupin domain-containing protein [Caballeronia sp. LZ003]
MSPQNETLQPWPLAGLREKDGRRWYAIAESDWRPMMIGDTILSGFFWIPVTSDETGAWSSYWMRLSAGARSMRHQHHSTELIMVLEGVFTDDDGAEFLPGQTVSYPAGSRHSTYSAKGCTVLVVEGEASSIVLK